MAKIDTPQYDLTLKKIDEKLEQEKKLEANRHYLGMSIIGHPCWRYLFYYFRSAEIREISADGAKAIEDGFDQETKMANRLRKLPFIQLHTENPQKPDEQIGYRLLLDHFSGHLDGMIKGVIEAPKTWHVWEHKSVNEKKFNELIKCRDKYGEKLALMNWDEIYYAQAIIYMHCSQQTRHYLTATTPGGRKYVSIRTECNNKIAEDLITKAKSIIFDNWSIPARLAEKREFYRCKWCEFQEICHDGKFSLVNCKTCRYRESVKDGQNKCILKEEIIPEEQLFLGCGEHIYNPALINAELIEHLDCGCIYKTKDGLKFANISTTGMPDLDKEIDIFYTSLELKDKIVYIRNLQKDTIKVQKEFNGTIVKDGEVNTKKLWDM